MTAVPMTPLRRALLGLALAGFVLGVLTTLVVVTSDHANLKGVAAVLSLLVGWSFLGTGLYAWDRRPDNLTGPLMVALAFAWFAGQLSNSNIAGLYAAGLVLESLPFAVLIHLLVAFPSGRIEQLADRFLVGLAYLLTVGYSSVTVLFFYPPVSDGCQECPANPLLVWTNQDLLDILLAIQNGLSAVATGVLFWRLVRRLRRASDDPNERARNAPVWWAGGASLLALLALVLTGFVPEESDFDDYVYALALAVLATVPYAYLLGVLRSKLWKAEVVAGENVRLDAELQARLEELRESRARIVEAGYAERRRVERDLHDGAQQRLVALALELQMVRAKLESDPGAAAELLEAAADELTGATQELRELARGLHPPVLADRGLVPALEALARRGPVPVEIEADQTDRAPEAVEAAAYFVVAEALTNVARHANAEQAIVRVAGRDGQLCVEIEDDGAGGADLSAGSGLRGLADRVGALGGSLEVDSGSGRGTTVRARLPVRG